MTIEQVQKLIGDAKKAVNNALYEAGNNLDTGLAIEDVIEDLTIAYRKVYHAGALLHNLQGRKGVPKT